MDQTAAHQPQPATPESARARLAPLNWEDPFGIDSLLTEEERMIRDTARAYCERIIGMSAGRVVFDGPARALDAEAVRTIYGTGAGGAEIDESVTSTAIRNPARQDNTKESAGPTPLALPGL